MKIPEKRVGGRIKEGELQAEEKNPLIIRPEEQTLLVHLLNSRLHPTLIQLLSRGTLQKTTVPGSSSTLPMPLTWVVHGRGL